jgi:hypothetical protein
MEDFYHTSPLDCRPQILALTASPEDLEGSSQKKGKKRKKKGSSTSLGLSVSRSDVLVEQRLQWRLDARLVTVADHLR